MTTLLGTTVLLGNVDIACLPPSTFGSYPASLTSQEDEQYLASKRYISEKFFNMRISHPEVSGRNGVGSVWEGVKGTAAGAGDDFGTLLSAGLEIDVHIRRAVS